MSRIKGILPRLSIRSKLIIAFVGLSVFPLLFVGLYGMYSNLNTLKAFAFENLTQDVHTVRERSGNFLAGAETDLRAMRNSSTLIRLINSLNHPIKIDSAILRDAESEILAFSRTKSIYYQISFVDEEQEELLRIECSDIAEAASQYRTVPRLELRDYGGSLYFLMAQDLAESQIAFYPAEYIYKESKKIPVVNFELPLYRGQKRVGILIASVFAGNLFQVMQPQRNVGADEKIVLVSSDGHYIYHSDLKNDWDRLIALRSRENLQMKYPASICNKILSGDEGIITETTDEIIAYAPLFPPQIISGGNHPLHGFTESMFVFESVPEAAILASAWSFAWTFAGFLVLFIFSAVVLGLFATAQFTRPIASVEEGAEIISKGNYTHRLNVRTGDEIENLAEQFNSMAAALEKHEREIAQHRLRLEEMVAHRTNELVMEKGKLQAIIDNVPSAFVLLDATFNILTASQAFTAITGLNLDDVRGKNCRELFRDVAFCNKMNYDQVVTHKKTESHIDRIIDKNGAERYIEHVTIPILEASEINSVVMIITDITQRKRLEEQLIQSEKLMATGEMSAIIAHEFRNALTSIKMILQLQHEVLDPASDDQKSLGVALDSIYHMESIVRELLNFARPTPMKFESENIAAIIDECLIFAQLRIHKQQIDLTKEIEVTMPSTIVDAPRLKEAVINLLINAIQAIESGGATSEHHSICVYAKNIILTKTLHDFAMPELREDENGIEERSGEEIVLRKGKDCLLIGVRDNGPGIDKERLKRIFDPFYTTKTNGTGLGLPMVKRTINAHGGIVVVKSSVGKGTAFEIVIPLQKQLLNHTL